VDQLSSLTSGFKTPAQKRPSGIDLWSGKKSGIVSGKRRSRLGSRSQKKGGKRGFSRFNGAYNTVGALDMTALSQQFNNGNSNATPETLDSMLSQLGEGRSGQSRDTNFF
jgi:hypothetical protein